MLEATFELLLKLPHIRVLRVDQTNAGAYLVTVESTLQHTTCHTCKRRIDTFYRLDDGIMLQHLSMCGSKVFIRLQPKRFRCPFCSGSPTTTQELPWYRPRSLLALQDLPWVPLDIGVARRTQMAQNEDMTRA